MSFSACTPVLHILPPSGQVNKEKGAEQKEWSHLHKKCLSFDQPLGFLGLYDVTKLVNQNINGKDPLAL